MKRLCNNYLVLIAVLLCFVAMPLVSVVAEDINISTLLNDTASKHIVRLYSLFLGNGTNGNYAQLTTDATKLTVSNWIMVWGAGNSLSESSLSSIGGGNGNTIASSSNAGIAWGQNNTITNWNNSVIWWWLRNNIEWENSVIAWWYGNHAYRWWIVLGWQDNYAYDWWIVLGWQGNNAQDLSLVMWKDAKGLGKSFAWNAEALVESARINAEKWVLIGTVTPINWVNLVVNWAIKLAWETDPNWVAWEIRAVNGCFYAYDGAYWHVINQNTESSCSGFGTMAGSWCQFGNVLLQAGDTVKAYNTVTWPCDYRTVQCGSDGKLKYNNSDTNYTSPYCYG